MATAKLALTFRIFKNDMLVREDKLTQTVIKIGKVPSAHLRIDDEKVSRMHAIIEVLGPEVSVIDLGSTGGTFVNGHRVNKAKLQSGDSISVGETRIEIGIASLDDAPSVVVSPALAAPTPVQPLPVTRTAPPPVPMATATLPATPVAARPVATRPVTAPVATVPPAAFQQAMAESAEVGGARAIEVAAMFGDSVVDVKHCMEPRSGKVTPLTWGFAAGGLACLLASAAAFYTSVDTAATNKAAKTHWTQELKRPAHAFRPIQQSAAVDVFAFGGLAFGLFGLTAALARSRRERRSPYYRIGTAPDVQQAVENAPTPSFPLVAPSGDDFVFNFAPGIDGELTVGDTSTPFADLIAQGRAHASPEIPGAFQVSIPMAAKIRARAGQTTFLVSAVNKPREQPTPLFAVERRTLGYAAGSLAVHLAAVAFLATIPIDGSNVNVDLGMDADTSLASRIAATEDPLQEIDPETNPGDDAGTEGTGAKMRLDEGASGKPDAPRTDGQLAIKDRHEEPRLSKEQAIEAARMAGVLGSTEAIRGGIASLTASDPFSSGFDDADIYGPLFGSQGEGRGNFGFGRNGWGPGGGCTQEPCGIVGAGDYGTIGTGKHAGEGWRGGGTWGNGRNRVAAVPKSTEIGMPRSGDGLDKAIIRRYIKRNLSKISYCYESELLARPGLEGQVHVTFLITPTGGVSQSTGAGFDSKIASCVAGVIKNIEFPRPTDGGNVQVNYPFTFHAAGQ